MNFADVAGVPCQEVPGTDGGREGSELGGLSAMEGQSGLRRDSNSTEGRLQEG